MIEKTMLYQLCRDSDVRYSTYVAPVATIHILGDDSSLKAFIFKDSCGEASAVEQYCKRGRTESIRGALTVLDAYFNGRGSGKKTGAGAPGTAIIARSGSFLITMHGITLALDMAGFTAKELTVYRELLKVKPGATISYGDLAHRAGIPGGARFAGNAMAKNNFPIIIPCHRVIKSDGSMGNYSGGIHIKKYLLDLEKSAEF